MREADGAIIRNWTISPLSRFTFHRSRVRPPPCHRETEYGIFAIGCPAKMREMHTAKNRAWKCATRPGALILVYNDFPVWKTLRAKRYSPARGRRAGGRRREKIRTSSEWQVGAPKLSPGLRIRYNVKSSPRDSRRGSFPNQPTRALRARRAREMQRHSG